MNLFRFGFRFSWLFVALAAASAGERVAGPMLAYQAHREVALWLETKDAESVTVTWQKVGDPASQRTLRQPVTFTSPIGTQPMTVVLPLLEMGQAYEYTLAVDGQPSPAGSPFTFKTTTQWEYRTPAPDFSFLFGSCAYLNDPPYDRPGAPYGQGTQIFRHMADSGADFMVWAGDNWYYREADFSSRSGLWYRASHDRATADLQPLFSRMHHYATWDDHDYGPNDANSSYGLKGVTLDIFSRYWPAQAYGLPDLPGSFQSFVWGDATFILMDNRTYRDDDRLDERLNPQKSQYGQRQRDWLKQALLAARERQSTFIILVTGGQVITDFGGASETFGLYRNERAELLTFIEDHNIKGVVFFSGDVHFTELARKQLGRRLVYEVTASPLSSAAWDATKNKDRMADPQRVEGTLVAEPNYLLARISGPKNGRVLTLQCFDKANQLRWTHAIPEQELR